MALTQVRKRLKVDLNKVNSDEIDWCDVELIDDNLKKWNCFIYGPEGTGYKDHIFNVTMDFTGRWNGPRVIMRTKMFHMNVNSAGHICLKVNDDSDVFDVRYDGGLTLLEEVYELMKNPDPTAVINVDALLVYVTHGQEEYDACCRAFSEKYAEKLKKKKHENEKNKNDKNNNNGKNDNNKNDEKKDDKDDEKDDTKEDDSKQN